MKIAIEAQRIFRPNKHGMDFVALETIRELQKMDHENEYFIFVSPGEDKCLKSSENMHVIELKCATYPLWEQVALPRAVKRIRPDLLHYQQYGSVELPRAVGADAARHHLSGETPIVQPVAISGDGMALPPPDSAPHTPQMQENHYSFPV